MKGFHRLATSVACFALLAGCATSYGPSGATGGYKETKIDDDTFQVRFDGNGNTPRDKVTNYWIYRCAELTVQNGYQYFTQVSQTPKTSWQEGDGWHMQQTKGYRAPTYVYTPGTTVYTYHADAVIRMFKTPMPADVPFALNATLVMEMLQDYVKSGGTKPAPTRDELLQRAGVRFGQST